MSIIANAGLSVCAAFFGGSAVAAVTYALSNRRVNRLRREAERERKRLETYRAWLEKLETLDPNSPEFEAAVHQRLDGSKR